MAGLGFNAQKSSAFKNEQWQGQDAVPAIAGTEVVKKIAHSPAAAVGKFGVRNAIAGAALPVAAGMDVANKAANSANWFFGGDPNYFNTNNTDAVLAKANPAPAVLPDTDAQPPVVAPTARASLKATQPVRPVPAIAGSIEPVRKQQAAAAGDITVDQYLTQIAGDQAAGRQTGKLPRGVTGYIQVVGDTMDDNFKATPTMGALLTDVRDPTTGSGYFTGSDFGNSRTSAGGGKTRMSEIAGAADQANQFRQQQAVARQQQISSRPQEAFKLPPVESYLDKIDPWFRKFDPTKALLLAHRMRNDEAKVMLGGQEIGQKGQQHGEEMQHKQNELTARKPVYDAQAGHYNAQAKLHEAQSLPGFKQKEQASKDYADRVKTLVGDWSKMHLPKEYVPKLNEYAKIFASAEDPSSNTWLMPPNRDGGMYAAMPRQYESVYQVLMRTMPQKDAAARVYQLAQQKGHAIDVPDFRRFLPTSDAIKRQDQAVTTGMITGAQ